MSHGLKAAPANLEEQTLHLTVRLQAGEEEEQEEEQDEEIGGLINSDGEVVEWDASKCLVTTHLWHSQELFKQFVFYFSPRGYSFLSFPWVYLVKNISNSLLNHNFTQIWHPNKFEGSLNKTLLNLEKNKKDFYFSFLFRFAHIQNSEYFCLVFRYKQPENTVKDDKYKF